MNDVRSEPPLGIAGIAYPGAMSLTDGMYLGGREDENQELFQACTRNDIIELTAKTGVGKTSFVNALLVPTLRERRDAYVPHSRTWVDAVGELGDHEPQNATEAAEILYRLWIGARPDDLRPLPEILSEQAKGKWTVVVLDQMEELIRHLAPVAERLLRLAGKLAVEEGIPHIVIARSEYREDLRPVEVGRAAVWPMVLLEIDDDEVLRTIIRTPARAAKVEVEEAACDTLIGWWRTARNGSDFSLEQRRTPIGLLQFQALLFAFQHWAVEDYGSATVVTNAMVERYGRASGVLAADETVITPAAAAALLNSAMRSYIDIKSDALTAPHTVRVGASSREILWRNGPRLMLARAAPAMSAVGYKQPQTLYSLIPYALADELTARGAADLSAELRRDPDPRREYDILTRHRMAHGSGLAEQWGDAGEESVYPDGRPRFVEQELLDCLRVALRVMTDANVLRTFGRADPIYELSHDGFGDALNLWAQDFLARPVATIGVLASQQGREVAVSLDGEELARSSDDELRLWGAEHDPDSGRVRLQALGWRSGIVRGRPPDRDALTEGQSGSRERLVFRWVSFERCHFTSTFFESCDFEEVVFESCDFSASALEDVELSRVTFRGCTVTSAFFAACALRDVVFEDCNFVTAALLGCSFENVRFAHARDGEATQALDLLTIIAPKPGADLTFTDAACDALFLRDLPDSTWHLDRMSVRYVAVDAHGSARFSLEGGAEILAASIAGDVQGLGGVLRLPQNPSGSR